MDEEVKMFKSNVIKAYKAGCSDVKEVLENLFGRETFVKPKITDRVKTLDDVFVASGTTKQEFYDKCYRNELTQDEIGYRLAKLVTEVLNEGWTPDWNNTSQRKWRLWFYLNQPGFRLDDANYGNTDSTVGSRLCFKDEETAIYAGKTFLDVYKQFFTE